MNRTRHITRLLAGAVVLLAALGACGDAAEPVRPATSTLPTSTTVATTVASSTTTKPVVTTTTRRSAADRCLDRAEFGDPADSPYVLPFPPGDGYSIIQSYCNDDGSHESQLAYDFAMPLGSLVVAARGGVVVEVKEDVPNDEYSRFLNQVLIRHDDGTVGFYAHLQHLGALVEVGDEVDQGDEIGLSGATGRTGGPVLHFGVFSTWPPLEGRDEPVVFRNADGPTDKRGGLRQGSFYRATPAP